MTSDQVSRLLAGAAEVIPEGSLQAKLDLGRPLRVKLGLDPTAADVTLGWAVVLRKLRQFQDEGHVAVLIVGDFTARVGDPSGKSETRPRLSKEVVGRYADRLLGQFWTILDQARTEVRYNSEWLESMDMEAVLRLTASYTVAQMLERDDFANRYAEGRPISLMEFLYPLLQGMDSVATEADVELGGTDQKFNLLVGRELQRDHGQDPQVAFTMPLLVGTDGVQKMSQSLGNYVGIAESPDGMYGKLVGVPDELVPEYRRLVLDFFADPEETVRVAGGLSDGTRDPWSEKRRMARETVDLYRGAGAGRQAEARFDRVHKDRDVPEDVEARRIPQGAMRGGRVWLPRLLVQLGIAASNSAARRLIVHGAVRLDGEQVMDEDAEYEPTDIDGRILQVGRQEHSRGIRLQT
jgi:tyrosyl-tRNA synthetase